jgi:hypothetical protein
MSDKPISYLNPVPLIDLPLNPNTLVEIAIPDVGEPTGFRSHKVKFSDLVTSIGAGGGGGLIYIAKDTTSIPIYDSGYQEIPVGKLLGDFNIKKFGGSFGKGFNKF